MYILMEATLTDKESQAYYTNYKNKDEFIRNK